MEARHNKEYHFFIDNLAERGFYGEVTLFFQKGNIESSRLNEKNTKSEIRKKMEEWKERKPRRVLTVVNRPKNGGAA